MHPLGTTSKDAGARHMMLLHLKALLVTWRQSLLHVAHAAKSAMERLANASLQFQLVAMIASTLTRLPAFPDRLPSTQEPRAQMRSSSNTHKSQEGKSSMVNSTSKPFFSRAVYMAKLPMHFLQDCLGAKSRVRHTAKSCAVGRPRHECLAKRKKTRQDFLR